MSYLENVKLIGTEFWVLFFLALVAWICVIVLFTLHKRHKDGNAVKYMTIAIGIFMSILCLVWLGAYISIKRDEINIASDVSTALISRDAIYTNFGPLNKDDNTPIVVTSNDDGMNDQNLCYPQTKVPGEGDKTNALFLQLAQMYKESGDGREKTVELLYKTKSSGANTNTYQDSLVNQQKLSLAYYRYNYCLQSLLGSLLAGDESAFSWMPKKEEFIENVVKNVDKPNPNKEGIGCQTKGEFDKTPDNLYCRTPNWQGGACADPNPCFTAMIETFSAHCLFENDGVSGKGVLEAFGLGQGVNLSA